MIVTNAAREKNTVTFDVNLDAAEFESFVNAAYKKNKSKITVTGFRKGRAPRMVIEGMYGKDVFYEDAINDAAPEAYAFAIDDQKLEPVGRPEIKDVKVTDETGLVLSFSTDVYPEVTLGEYKGLKAPRRAAEVADSDVEDEIQRLRKQNGRIVAAEKAAENGDTVNIDYAGTVDGIAFEGGTAEGHNLVLGSNAFIPGFEDQLIGISAGEERDITVTFPEDYMEDLAGKEAVFHVKCNEVKKEELPELDDEFAQDNDYDTLDAMKDGIRAKLLETRQKAADEEFADALVDQAVANMTVEVPEGMYEDRMDSMAREFAQYMSAQGLRFEDYLKMTGSDYNTFRETNRPTAVKQVNTELLLKAVIDAEKLEASEEAVEKEFQEIADMYSMSIDDVKKAVDPEEIKGQILRKMAVQVISDAGIATEPEEAPVEEGAEE